MSEEFYTTELIESVEGLQRTFYKLFSDLKDNKEELGKPEVYDFMVQRLFALYKGEYAHILGEEATIVQKVDELNNTFYSLFDALSAKKSMTGKQVDFMAQKLNELYKEQYASIYMPYEIKQLRSDFETKERRSYLIPKAWRILFLHHENEAAKLIMQKIDQEAEAFFRECKERLANGEPPEDRETESSPAVTEPPADKENSPAIANPLFEGRNRRRRTRSSKRRSHESGTEGQGGDA